MTATLPDSWVDAVHVRVRPRAYPRGDRWLVKWKVRTDHTRSFPTSPVRGRPQAIADAFRIELVRAQSAPGVVRFHAVSGLPEAMHRAEQPETAPEAVPSALDVAVAVLAAEWPSWSPGNRKSRVETMSAVVAALVTEDLPRGVTLADARRALRDLLLPPDGGGVKDPSSLTDAVHRAAAWLPAHVRPVTDLTLSVVEAALLDASRQLTGVFYGGDRIGATRGSLSLLCAEAVRRGLLPANPVRDAKRVSEMAPVIVDPDTDEEDPDAAVVDPERVMDADQCRAFCAAVREVSHVSWKFAVFLTLLWTTGMRPSEALGIRNAHKRLHLAADGGWGWVRLWRPTVDAGAARWTGTGSKHADKTTLKARKKGVERLVPLPPETVVALRELLERNQTRPGARLFVNQNQNPFTLDHLGRVFRSVRAKLHPAPVPETDDAPAEPGSPLCGVTMYQLRHSFVTTCIERGVTIVKIAELVGNSGPTINRVYARLLTTDDEDYKRRMDGVFGE